jgi:hypothetical protein
MVNSKFLIPLIFFLVMGMVFLAGCSNPKPTVSPASGPAIASGSGKSITSLCITPVPAKLGESLDFASHFTATELLTRPTNNSVTVSLIPKEDSELFFEYGTSPGSYSCQTTGVNVKAGSPSNSSIQGLMPDSHYYYRTCYKVAGSSGYQCGPEHTFYTQRLPGSTFTFGIQADSHPERDKQMFNSALYDQTMSNVVKDQPDFYITLGDDFSIDPLIEKNQLSQATVDGIYLNQRKYLGGIGSDSPIFLVNGNHEEAAQYLLDGTPHNAAVYAGTSRMQFFPQPIPDEFYSGNTEAVEFVGLPGDYYAWTWGDALFVVIDPYWHSPVAVDNVIGKNVAKKRDLGEITLGDAQYQWFKKTLEQSNASYKFVFAHHVLGTGRGGIENAGLFEWGGGNQKGTWVFDTLRPGWELPIHQLMAKNGVTIFFQGHDHLFARQELDSVTYQEVPLPADPTYSMFNADAYRSGTKLPNSGYLQVTVSSCNITVDYVKSYLLGKETASEKNGMVAYSYMLSGDNS